MFKGLLIFSDDNGRILAPLGASSLPIHCGVMRRKSERVVDVTFMVDRLLFGAALGMCGDSRGSLCGVCRVRYRMVVPSLGGVIPVPFCFLFCIWT